MEEINQQQLDELLNKIGRLAEQQDLLQREINNLKRSISQLKSKTLEKAAEPQAPLPAVEIIRKETPVVVPSQKPVEEIPPPKAVREKTPIEEFIGTNLLNKIGIIILVLGISYGVKYSIDHNLINPLTRVI